MLNSLPSALREEGLSADVRTLLLLRKAIEKGLIKTLGDVYNVLKGIVVKEPTDMGPYTRAYYRYFLDIDIQDNESLQDAILRSETFEKWKTQFLDEADKDVEYTLEDLVNRFLDQVHITNYDIKELISGREIFDKDNPDLEDSDPQAVDLEPSERNQEKMADYSDVSLEELLERMKKVRDQQNTKHGGGSHWIGTGGISPYGHGGAAKNGIRVGGSGGGKMARKVIGDKNYFPVEKDRIINDDNIDAALSSIKGVIEESSVEQLDIPVTIQSGLKRGGLFIPELTNEKSEKLQIIVLIDNGGYSMSPYIKTVQNLFKKMRTRFAHDLEVYYFHNTIGKVVFQDARRSKRMEVERLLQKDKNYRVFVIGDAAMAPYELDERSIQTWQAIRKKFKKTVWLNPDPVKYWHFTYTIQVIKKIIPMFPLTPNGIERAVREMNRKTNG